MTSQKTAAKETTVGAVEKKIIFYFIGTFMSLFCCQSIVEASEKWN